MMLVAWPVSDASAILRTGANGGVIIRDQDDQDCHCHTDRRRREELVRGVGRRRMVTPSGKQPVRHRLKEGERHQAAHAHTAEQAFRGLSLTLTKAMPMSEARIANPQMTKG